MAASSALSVALGAPTVASMGTSSVSMTFLGGSAGYNSSYGVYTIGADGLPTTGKVVWANVTNANATSTLSGLD
ncbi:MAG: hypothetical protein ACK5U4_24165, partial [Rhodospirillales bacterium]